MTKATLYRIELELAREPGHPEGDPGHTYRLYLPLTNDGYIDQSGYRDMPEWCRVVRKRPGDDPARGRILRGPGGRWLFDYSDASTLDDEVGFRLSEERFVPGEYVSIREDDGKMHVFRIASVQPD
ncbi:hypothetical protein [Devosia sp. SL43]|uniref:hypothetical protein n=1 Tax=Devosia sp. SL43 TaxID=2806348 RepID=UPI001F1BFDE4|nr:hypothetical protein [Devosia sp. SL43]UJW85019.1 hypothetical protein IM737_16645 [Devosia sp. SL43]